MKFGQDFEKVFFKLSLQKPKYLEAIKKGFYTSEEIDAMHYLATKFYEKFHEAPSKEQMKLLIQRGKKEVDEDLIDIVYASDLTQYDEEWMNSTAESWIKWRNFDTTLIDTIEYIKTTQVNPDNVDDIISKVKGLINDRNSLTFNSDLGLDFFNPTDHFQEGVTKFSTGYNFLDRALGGGYDKDGTLRNWWTDEDRSKFKVKATALQEQFDAYTVLDTVHVNGKLTLGENIGDLGGLGIAYKAYLLSLKGADAPEIDGRTAAQRFFIAWSQSWRAIGRDEMVLQRLATDPHSPAEFRCNQIVRNIDVFYDAFDVKPSDKLWLEPEERVVIW